MNDPIDFDQLGEASPMFKAFRGQFDALGPRGRSYDLTALWKAAGRPRGHAPRHYLHRFREAMRGEVRDQGGGPDGAVLVDDPAALHYCTIVDRRIMDAVVDESIRRRRKDPVRALLECPNPIMAMLVKTDPYLRGLGDEQADRLLIEAAKRAAAGPDVYAEETRVAEVQRAVASFGPVEAGPPPGSGRPNSR